MCRLSSINGIVVCDSAFSLVYHPHFQIFNYFLPNPAHSPPKQARLDYSVQDFLAIRQSLYTGPKTFDSRCIERIDDDTEIMYVNGVCCSHAGLVVC